MRAAPREQVRTGRLGTPEEVADVVAGVASDQASYLSATTVVDGGFETCGPSV